MVESYIISSGGPENNEKNLITIIIIHNVIIIIIIQVGKYARSWGAYNNRQRPGPATTRSKRQPPAPEPLSSSS